MLKSYISGNNSQQLADSRFRFQQVYLGTPADEYSDPVLYSTLQTLCYRETEVFPLNVLIELKVQIDFWYFLLMTKFSLYFIVTFAYLHFLQSDYWLVDSLG